MIIDVQRAGPSTGMPTKPEQADLLMALYGRNSETPGAGARRGDARRLLRLRARGGADRGQVPHARLPALGRVPRERRGAVADPRRSTRSRRSTSGSRPSRRRTASFLPYRRDPETLARPWAIPGTPGLEHRIGGLEKQDVTGNVCYDPDNHDQMVRLRAQKVAGIAADIPRARRRRSRAATPSCSSSAGAARTGRSRRRAARARGAATSVAHAHLRYLNPFPRNTGDVLRRYEGARAGDEPRPAAEARARRVPRRRGRLQPRPRAAVHGGRARTRRSRRWHERRQRQAT